MTPTNPSILSNNYYEVLTDFNEDDDDKDNDDDENDKMQWIMQALFVVLRRENARGSS